MTGRIKRLAVGTDPGSIQAEGGLHVSFEPSGVVAYDLDKLVVGQLVTFDIEGSTPPTAVNILSVKSPPASTSEQRRRNPKHLRYAGFEQIGSMRTFRFEQIVPGEERLVFLVSAELALFTKHHIGLQEGPALCLHLLATEADSDGADGPVRVERSLSDRDMLAHISRRPVPPQRTQPRPKRNRSAADSSNGPI